VKPVEPRVLLARIEALLRRARPGAGERREERLVAGRLHIDGARRAASIDARAIDLTTGDFDILWLLASRQGQVVTRDEILRVVRGIDYDGLDRSIDARICRLRKKLQDAGGAESMIKTVRLRGYLFTGDA
jgi:DNA-binding response OmpR family regulator